MSLVGSGAHNDFAFGVPSDSKSADGYEIVSKMTDIPVDAKNILCVATGWSHTVIVMKDGRVLAAGDDTEFRIGSERRKIYKEFTEIKISDEKILWAAAGEDFTLYLTENWRVILCHKKLLGVRINIHLPKKAVSVFAGRKYGAIIDEEGSVYLLDKENPQASPEKFSFPSPAIEVACCISFCVVLLNNFSVYGNEDLNNEMHEFSLVSSLRDQKIMKITGYSSACLALNGKGVVFSYGANNYGQLGVGSTNPNYESFSCVQSLSGKCVKDIACSYHSLFLTEDDELYGCGWNDSVQLFKRTKSDNVLYPSLVSKGRNISSVFAGNVHSLALCGADIENPAQRIFLNSQYFQSYVSRNSLHKKINDLNAEIGELKTQHRDDMKEIKDSPNELKSLIRQIVDETFDIF